MQVPFPHILSSTLELMNNTLRVVTDKLGKDNSVYEPFTKIENPETKQMELAYYQYQFEKVNTKRKAKGDWSKWKIHPTYLEGIGSKKKDFVFESSLNK